MPFSHSFVIPYLYLEFRTTHSDSVYTWNYLVLVSSWGILPKLSLENPVVGESTICFTSLRRNIIPRPNFVGKYDRRWTKTHIIYIYIFIFLVAETHIIYLNQVKNIIIIYQHTITVLVHYQVPTSIYLSNPCILITSSHRDGSYLQLVQNTKAHSHSFSLLMSKSPAGLFTTEPVKEN